MPHAATTSDIDVKALLQFVVEKNATDLHIRAGTPAKLRLDGDLADVDDRDLSPEDCEFFLRQIVDESQWHTFTTERELDFAYALTVAHRFRVNAYWHLGTVGIAFRLNRSDILDFDKLNLPPVVRDLCHQHRGMVLVTGITGSGKSTTLATMLGYINKIRKCHIITIEDPIEFLHQDINSLVSQREVGYDTKSFLRALRSSLREDPDVILVGEMRDVETIRAAVSAAETGHLVFSTLHTTQAYTTVERVLGFFSPTEQVIIRGLLAENLKGVICQRLLPRLGGGLVPALEIMVGTSTVQKLIAEDRLRSLTQAIQNKEGGMQTFNQALLELLKAGSIDEKVAMSASSNPQALRRMMLGGESGGDSTSIIG